METVHVSSPTLLIDQTGILGQGLANELLQTGAVVFVGGRKEEKTKTQHNIPYTRRDRRLPKIPNIPYQAVYIFWNKENVLLSVVGAFLKKAARDKAPVYFIVPHDAYDNSVIEKLRASHSQLAIVVFGEMFSLELPEAVSRAQQILLQAVKGRVLLVHDGLAQVHPVALSDTLHILSVLPKEGKTKGVYYLFPRHATTELGIIRIIQKKEPLVRVDFLSKKEKQRAVHILKEGVFLLEDSYNWQEKIQIVTQEIIQKTKHTEQKEERPVKKKSPKTFFWQAVSFAVFFLLLPLLATAFFSLFGFWELYTTRNLLLSGALQKARGAVAVSQSSFLFSRISAELLVSEAALLGKEDIAQAVLADVNTGQEVSAMLVSGIDASLQLQNALQGRSKDPQEDILAAANTLKTIAVEYDTLKEEKRIPQMIVSRLDEYNDAIKLFTGSQDVLPFLLGFDSQKTYLVLFQNNMELRPGGGFIGSYAIVNVKNGQMGDFVIHDVYDADGQLKGHVEPPFAIRRYLPSVHWYLRDSNFSMDMATNASSAALFANAEMHEEVDGVLAIDVSFLQQLLAVTGPVVVSEYGQTVTTDNMYLLTEQHAEKNFFPGSTQKKDFLKSLSLAIMHKIVDDRSVSYARLAKVIAQSIEEKHVLLSVENSHVQEAMVQTGFSSDLTSPGESADIPDFFGVVEANLGVDKANYFLKRKVTQEVSLSEKGITETATVYYKNTSNGAWPGGEYKNYLQFALPNGARLQGITIDGVLQNVVPAITDPSVYEAKTFVPPTGLEVEQSQEDGRSTYGFLLIVPQGGLKTVSVSYTIPFNFGNTPSSYALDVFKQPGQSSDPYEFSLQLPNDWQILDAQKSDAQAVLTKDKTTIHLTTKLARDFEITVKVGKK